MFGKKVYGENVRIHGSRPRSCPMLSSARVPCFSYGLRGLLINRSGPDLPARRLQTAQLKLRRKIRIYGKVN